MKQKLDELIVECLTEDKELVPYYASEHAAGADVRACIDQPIEIEPGQVKLIPTGLRLGIPEGYEVQVRPRSGLALKSSVTVLNTPGTIDSDYKGELKVILINHGKEIFTVEPKMRIAQIIVAPVCRADFSVVEELALSARGTEGFGSTGLN